MLLVETEKPFRDDEYIFEVKMDGIRAVLFVDGNGVYIQSRNKKDMTELFPELECIKKLVKGRVIFDGEIVLLENGNPSFSKLQKRMRTKNRSLIAHYEKENPVIFFVFDIIFENESLCDKTLVERKKILNKFPDTCQFVKAKNFGSDGIKLFKAVKKENLEGIVAKLKKGTYHIDERTDDFIKIKNIKIDNFKVCGYIEKEKSVSLILGHEEKGKIVSVGKVVIGKKNSLYKKLKGVPLDDETIPHDEKGAVYIKPVIEVRCEYLEKTKGAHLRHAIFKGENE